MPVRRSRGRTGWGLEARNRLGYGSPVQRSTLILLVGLCLGVPVCLTAAPHALAEDEASVDAEQIATWIEGLRDAAYATREAARRGLEAHGARFPAVLQKHAEDADPEVRLLVRRLLEKSDGGVVEPTRSGDPAQLGRVLLPQGTTSEAEALATLGVPAMVELQPQGVRPPAPETLDLGTAEALPWYRAMDRVLAALRLRRQGIVSSAAVLRVEDAAKDAAVVPEDAQGPFLLRVVEVTRTARLTQPGPEKLQLGLELAWSPLVQVALFQNPKLIACTAPDGSDFARTEQRSVMNYGVAPQQMSRETPLLLRRVAGQDATKIDRLEVEVPVTVRHGRRSVRLSLAEELPGKAVAAQGSEGTALVRAFTTPDGRSQRHYGVDLTLRLPGVLADQSVACWLVFSDASRERLIAMGGRSRSADGTVELTTRAWVRGRRGPAKQEAPTPAFVDVVWFEEELQGSLRFVLRDIPVK